MLLAGCSVAIPKITPPEEEATAAKPKKGSGQTSATEAKSSGQKAGTRARGARDQATVLEEDPDGVPCDEEDEGTALCTDDDTMVWCEDSTWYSLDCVNVEPEAGPGICAEIVDTSEIDCFVDDEDGEYELVDIDADGIDDEEDDDDDGDGILDEEDDDDDGDGILDEEDDDDHGDE